MGADADSRYKKIVAHIEQLQDALVDVFIRPQARQEVPQELVIDFDPTDELMFFADRTSTHNLRSNQLRLLFSTSSLSASALAGGPDGQW